MFFCLILKYLRFIYFPSVYSVSSVVNSYIQIYLKTRQIKSDIQLLIGISNVVFLTDCFS